MAKSAREVIRDFILDMMKSQCIEVTRLISERMDRPSSTAQWIKICFHLALCEYCREYETQLKTLHKLTQNLEKQVPAMESRGGLRLESREKLKRLIEKEH